MAGLKNQTVSNKDGKKLKKKIQFALAVLTKE